MITEEEFVKESKRLGKTKEQTIKKLEKLRAEGFFNQKPAATEKPEMSTTDYIRGVGQSSLVGQIPFAKEGIAGLRTLMDAAVDTDAEEAARNLVGGEKQGFFEQVKTKFPMYLKGEQDFQRDFGEEAPLVQAGANLVGGIASPLNRVMPNAGAGRVLPMAGRGAVEGALYGAGEGRTAEERLTNAGVGALTGGLFSGLTQGVMRGVSDRRIAQDIGSGDSQIPLNLAAPDSRIGKFYRAFVGNSFGGRGKIAQQEADYLTNNPRLSRLVGDVGEETGSAQPLIDRARNNIAGQAANAKDAIKQQKVGLTNATREQKRLIGQNKKAQNEILDLELQNASRQFDDASNTALNQMRLTQAQRTLPPDAPEDLVELAKKVDTPEGMEAFTARLDDFWTKDGYGLVRQAQVKPTRSLITAIRNATADPELAQQYVDALEEAMKTGRTISGDFIMEVRNNLARARPPEGMKKGAYQKLINGVDESFKSILGRSNKAALNQFEAHNAVYGNKNDFLKAVQRSQERLTPMFDANDLNRASGKSKNKTAGQRESQRLAKATKAQIDAAEQQKQQQSKLIKSRRKQIADAADIERGQVARKTAKQSSFLDNRKKRVEQRQRAMKNRLNNAMQGRITDNPSAWSMLASTTALGLPFAGAGPAAIAAGAGVASTLANKNVQRAVAGQTGWQQAMAKALREGDWEAYQLAASRLAALQATGE